MDQLIIKEKLAICHTICGPTYRNSAIKRLENYYPDHPNLYYFVIVDDKKPFEHIQRRNLIVKELSEFYVDYPEIEEFEKFLESGDDVEDYGNRFLEQDYKFPFPVMRFHLKLAEELGICNVALMATDTDLLLDKLEPFGVFDTKNLIYNTVSWWQEDITNHAPSALVAKILKEKYELVADQTVMVYDEASRLYVFENVEKMRQLFDMWHEVVLELHRTGELFKMFRGWIIIHDEHLLAVIYNVIGIGRRQHMIPIFNTLHDSANERPWRIA